MTSFKLFRSAACIIAVCMLLPVSARAQSRAYTFQGDISFVQASDNILENHLALLRDTFSNGTSFTLSFNLDLNTPDSDPATNVGAFLNASTGQTAQIGDYAFVSLPVFSCENAFECRLQATNFDLGPFVQFSTYTLNPGLTFSAGLGDLLLELNPPSLPSSFQAYVSAGFSFTHSFDGLLDLSAITDITDVPFNVARRLALTVGDSSTGGNGLGEIEFDVALTGVQSNLLISPIPEPETYAMMLAGLGLLGWHARRRKLKQTAA